VFHNGVNIENGKSVSTIGETKAEAVKNLIDIIEVRGGFAVPLEGTKGEYFLGYLKSIVEYFDTGLDISDTLIVNSYDDVVSFSQCGNWEFSVVLSLVKNN
jgi:hypothetical protein